MADHLIDVVDARDLDTARQLLDLQRASYRVEADLIEFEGIPPLYEPLEVLMEQPLEWRAIRADGRIVAAIAITGERRECDIDRLVVSPDWFRHGFGRRLVESVLHHEVVTVSTGTRNTPARRLYESLGFTVSGTKDIGLGATATQYVRRPTHLRTSFDADVEGYESARPGYPGELFDLLAERAGLGPGARVLEIGPGTGQATLSILDRQATVVAVELGASMAARLRTRTSGRACTVVEGAFEEVDVDHHAPFDLAISATAFHWVDAAVGVPKLARLVRPGGHLALVWNAHRAPHDPEIDRDDERENPFGVAVTEIAARFQTEARRNGPLYAFDRAGRSAEIEAGGHFELVEHRMITWPYEHDARSMRALFATFSDWSTLPEPDRSRALDDIATLVEEQHGGRITQTYTTVLYLARRVGRD